MYFKRRHWLTSKTHTLSTVLHSINIINLIFHFFLITNLRYNSMFIVIAIFNPQKFLHNNFLNFFMSNFKPIQTE